jgi:hypothetical protein
MLQVERPEAFVNANASNADVPANPSSSTTYPPDKSTSTIPNGVESAPTWSPAGA